MKPNRASFAAEMASAIFDPENLQSIITYDLTTGQFGSRAWEQPQGQAVGEIDVVAAWDSGYDPGMCDEEGFAEFFSSDAYHHGWTEILLTIDEVLAGMEVRLYEDNDGGLAVLTDVGIGWDGMEHTDGDFAGDAEAICNGDTDDWTVDRVSKPSGKHVATYQDGKITWISNNLGVAAERYIGRSVVSVADAAELRGVAKITVNKWISDQGLKARMIGNQYVIRLSDLMEFDPAPVGRPS